MLGFSTCAGLVLSPLPVFAPLVPLLQEDSVCPPHQEHRQVFGRCTIVIWRCVTSCVASRSGLLLMALLATGRNDAMATMHEKRALTCKPGQGLAGL